MSWFGVGGAVVGAIGSMGSKGGGGGGQAASKDPWAAAVPWLTDNLKSGQDLQAQYKANPFSQQQQQSYQNQFANSDYARTLTGSILGQMNGFQPFDRSNPTARPQMFQFPSMTQGLTGDAGGAGVSGGGNLLHSILNAGNAAGGREGLFTTGVLAPAPAAAPEAPKDAFAEWRKADGRFNGTSQMGTPSEAIARAYYNQMLLDSDPARTRDNAGPGNGSY